MERRKGLLVAIARLGDRRVVQWHVLHADSALPATGRTPKSLGVVFKSGFYFPKSDAFFF